MPNDFFVDSKKLSPAALEKKHRLESDPSCRRDIDDYYEGMERIDSDVAELVLNAVKEYDPLLYGPRDVVAALEGDRCGVDQFKALLSPAAEPYLEKMAQRAARETAKHFGNTVYVFTPLYIANYCENYCVYCGFNCYNDIRRVRLDPDRIDREMKIIADSGMEEILILTGESRSMSGLEYIGDACAMA